MVVLDVMGAVFGGALVLYLGVVLLRSEREQ